MDLAAVVERLDAFVRARMAADRTPGLALALTDRERTIHHAEYGYADLAARTPVTPATLFEIGSIGKCFTAILCLRLAEAGTLDLHAPVTRYLPWFAVRSDHAPITLHHLLSHTAGITVGTDATPDARSEVWALRETETGGPPGERFHYSNVGYKTLGLVLAAATGRPYPELVEREIVAPLGLSETAASIDHQLRSRMAVGYHQGADDVPPSPGMPLVPAVWLETDTADGCLAASAADLAVFLRMLLNRGAAPAGPILSLAGFELMIQPHAPGDEDGTYGYGIYTYENDGRRRLWHGGGMPGFGAMMEGDLDTGVGAVVLANDLRQSWQIGVYAVDLLVAAREGRALPEPPAVVDPTIAPDAAAYAGVYRSGDRTLAVEVDGGRLAAIMPEGGRVELVRIGDDAFAIRDPAGARFPLRFGRDGERVVEVWHGGDWFAGDGYAGPTEFGYPAAWDAYLGHYRSHNPWATNFRVVARKGRLWLTMPGAPLDSIGGEEPLEPIGPLADGRFRVGDDPASPERLSFDAVVEGQALRAILSGGPYYRFFTP